MEDSVSDFFRKRIVDLDALTLSPEKLPYVPIKVNNIGMDCFKAVKKELHHLQTILFYSQYY